MSPWVVLIVVALSVEALAGPEVQVPQADAVPLLDGKADEGFWADAAVLDGFTLFDPNTTGVKKFDAEAKVVVGAEALYFFVDVRLGSDAVIYAPFSERDRIRGDQLQIHIDPFAEGRRGYGFRVNARGVLGDMLINATGSQDDSWDSLFDASTTIRDDGWSAELAIPFRSLRFDPRQEKWSAHVYVESWDHQQSISWAPIDRNERNWLTLAGTLEGLEGREPGRAIEVLPSVTLRSEESEENPLPGCKFEASAGSVGMCGVEGTYGVGLKWGITPSLTLDGVFNPDYSQIEADANQLSVNNRFALYLPERRPFFLEGADIFSMRVPVRSSRALGRTVSPLSSRSVGRPDFAMKLTGQQGSVRVGAFFATDPESPGSTNDDFTMHAADPEDPELEHVYESRRVLTTVARAQVDVSRKATVGAVLVERDWLGDGQRVANNLVFGADGQAYLSKALNL
ncbi:MAG: DUF5916 domain-containing protein, partial [Myxococcota bacterium]|nr:DUF5916 domain-containing protein [Myxococcota bacterium]